MARVGSVASGTKGGGALRGVPPAANAPELSHDQAKDARGKRSIGRSSFRTQWSWQMTTPGFTAEASVAGRAGHHRQANRELVGAGEPLVLAQSVSQVSPSPGLQSLPNGLEVYGNWCGPGHGGSGTPIDAVDEVCCRHDQCYCEDGYLDCSCDRDLLADMPSAIADPDTPAKGRVAGLGAISFFSISPCVCWTEVCYPVPWQWPPWDCSSVPFPGIPGLKRCLLPYD